MTITHHYTNQDDPDDSIQIEEVTYDDPNCGDGLRFTIEGEAFGLSGWNTQFDEKRRDLNDVSGELDVEAAQFIKDTLDAWLRKVQQ